MNQITDPAEQLRAHQATIRAQQMNHAEYEKQEQQQAHQLATFIEKFRLFLIQNGSRGLSRFRIEQPGSTYDSPKFSEMWGWKIGTNPGNYDTRETSVMLCQNGSLWLVVDGDVLLEKFTYLTGKFVLGQQQLHATAYYYNLVIPGIARLLDELDLQWDGGDRATVSTPASASSSTTTRTSPPPTRRRAERQEDGRVTARQVDLLISRFRKFMVEHGSHGLITFEVTAFNRAKKAQGWVITQDDRRELKLLVTVSGDLWVVSGRGVTYSNRVGSEISDYEAGLLKGYCIEAGITKIVRAHNLEREWDALYG